MTGTSELTGKVAVVTGGARRIGRAIAMRLAESGASVVIGAHTALDKAREVAKEAEALGVEAFPVAADITKPDEVARMIAAVMERFGRIDILVNNAAIRRKATLVETSFEEWHYVLASILDGAFLCSQACAPHLVASEGAIVNIGGASAHFGSPDQVHVMTAKAGLAGLTRALAVNLAPKVVVNCLVPGRIQHPGDAPSHAGGFRAFSLDRIPLARAGTPAEIAEGVSMLCSPRSRFLNGQMIHMNGGMYYSG